MVKLTERNKLEFSIQAEQTEDLNFAGGGGGGGIFFVL